MTDFGQVLTPLFQGLVKTMANGGKGCNVPRNTRLWTSDSTGDSSISPFCHNPSGPSKRVQKGCPKMVDFRWSNLWIPEMMRSRMGHDLEIEVEIMRSRSGS